MAATPEAPERTETTASPLDRHAAPVTDHPTDSGRTHDGRATAAMIISIIAIPLALLSPLFGFPTAIVGTVLGAVAKRDIERTGRSGAGQAKAGLICGIIALAVCVISVIVSAIILSSN